MRSSLFLMIVLFINLLYLSIGSAQIVVAAVGNIACNSTNNVKTENCQLEAIANLINLYNVNAILSLDNNQNLLRRHEALPESYNQIWKNFKDITYPVPDNRNYASKGPYDYSGKIKREFQKGYYSFDLGAWHLIALNANCAEVNGCGSNSPQVKWLEQDLKDNLGKCTLAYWQNSPFNSDDYNGKDKHQVFWEVLYANKADVILNVNGNEYSHTYQRFTSQKLTGKVDSESGLQAFVIGTDKKLFNQLKMLKKINLLAVENTNNFGALFLALYETSYLWWFESVAGEKFQDLGATTCY